jgi:hypothetical protein
MDRCPLGSNVGYLKANAELMTMYNAKVVSLYGDWFNGYRTFHDINCKAVTAFTTEAAAVKTLALSANVKCDASYDDFLASGMTCDWKTGVCTGTTYTEYLDQSSSTGLFVTKGYSWSNDD